MHEYLTTIFYDAAVVAGVVIVLAAGALALLLIALLVRAGVKLARDGKEREATEREVWKKKPRAARWAWLLDLRQ